MTSSIMLAVLIFCGTLQSDSFKKSQLRYSRVRQAYKDKEMSMRRILQEGQIEKKRFEIYLRAFKRERQIELWGKSDTDTVCTLLKTYEICDISGGSGPKRKEGDLQIPEGFYHIDRFNPYSNFYLSLGINYPNTSDRILGLKGKLGGDIFIHGACVTIGCLPITDEQIKELYIFCVEARNNGQLKIPVTIFPSKLTAREYERLTNTHKADADKIGLWRDLKKSYDAFNLTKQRPKVKFLSSGRHDVRK